MRALVKTKREKGLELQEVPTPVCGPNQCLIKIEKTAICGTDLHIYEWDAWAQKTIPVPMHVGHEYMGRVVEVGELVKGITVGMRVSGEGHIVCGHCRNCRAGARHLCIRTQGIGVNLPGAFAEYLALPAENVFPLPDDISDEEASILDPLGNAVHTALSYDLVGEDVLVTGAGPIGIMAGAVALHVGAKRVVITDVNPYRLELAKKLGIQEAIDSRTESLKDVMARLKMKEGFDVGLEMSGHPLAIKDMITSMRAGGKIALLGILPNTTLVDWDAIIFKGLNLKGIYGREMFETWYKMISMLQSGLDIRKIITHRLPVEEFAKGFHQMNLGQSGKVILDWKGNN
jgi:threonine 3-dehydrogenase